MKKNNYCKTLIVTSKFIFVKLLLIKICKINYITHVQTNLQFFVINKYVINLLPVSYSIFGSPMNTEL